MSLYYEIHVTLHPDFTEDRLEEVKAIGLEHHYHMADLVYLKGAADRAEGDMFFTTRTTFFEDAVVSVDRFCEDLAKANFRVLRYKIEDTIMDSRIDDRLGLCHH